MYQRIGVSVVAILLAAGSAQAASKQVQYGPPPAWVVPAPKTTEAPTPEGAPMRVVYNDLQTRLGRDGDEMYIAYRVKLLTPEALMLGNTRATWNAGSDDIFVHALKIYRGDRVIDVLADNKFQVLQRENNLDYAMLDGQMTAVLQTPGLQVGDEIVFAATIRRKDPTLGDRSYGAIQIPPTGQLGAYRMRLVWPDGRPVQWRATPDLGTLSPVASDDRNELTYELRDPKSAIVADGAPSRVNLRRTIEYSGFTSWADVSHHVQPLFDGGATLAPNSPVREEARKIAQQTGDPTARAEAALRLVQDRIRYVYVGLDGGNFRPATADETWSRRFGDCKAKTVLLIALLRELGVSAEPVLGNTAGGDGTNERLPSPTVFNHVLVKATIGGRAYWLDGTRMGDRGLATLPPPPFRWALPVRSGTVDLEPVAAEPPAVPQLVEVIAIDASRGPSVPARFKAQQVMRGDAVVNLRTTLAGLSPDDAERQEKAYWRQQLDQVEPDTVTWRYDEAQGALILAMEGEGKPGWEGDAADGQSLDIYGAGFSPPGEYKRPKEQDQAAPWLTEYPRYRCWATTIRLPPAGPKRAWTYRAEPVNRRLGGVAYWREAELRDGVVRTVMSRRVYTPEITAAEAKATNDALPTFDNNISIVFEAPARLVKAAGPKPVAGAPAFGVKDPDVIDWSSPDAPCAAPAEPPSPSSPKAAK
ncbi:transglutaminase-like enzyme, predicted cysteine protease [Caulobacter sp. AP07]|uniref:DUF3857 domain-containing transglutaminase family protein n=1 Tax=Caulobacter sp. AP07 TaxID=1144304 RepID=UPI000271F767|nr:DUF3857 domain-containing transglutaminase family protein [Caulobacter sp. AP07]EJL33944.1 transglutaminase-like enzyme, predicted cysteine protease [Caulobacter sp. AP07]